MPQGSISMWKDVRLLNHVYQLSYPASAIVLRVKAVNLRWFQPAVKVTAERRFIAMGEAGAEARIQSADIYGPAEAVPLLQTLAS
jgi:hypothetical protein